MNIPAFSEKLIEKSTFYLGSFLIYQETFDIGDLKMILMVKEEKNLKLLKLFLHQLLIDVTNTVHNKRNQENDQTDAVFVLVVETLLFNICNRVFKQEEENAGRTLYLFQTSNFLKLLLETDFLRGFSELARLKNEKEKRKSSFMRLAALNLLDYLFLILNRLSKLYFQNDKQILNIIEEVKRVNEENQFISQDLGKKFIEKSQMKEVKRKIFSEDLSLLLEMIFQPKNSFEIHFNLLRLFEFYDTKKRKHSHHINGKDIIFNLFRIYIDKNIDRLFKDDDNLAFDRLPSKSTNPEEFYRINFHHLKNEVLPIFEETPKKLREFLVTLHFLMEEKRGGGMEEGGGGGRRDDSRREEEGGRREEERRREEDESKREVWLRNMRDLKTLMLNRFLFNPVLKMRDQEISKNTNFAKMANFFKDLFFPSMVREYQNISHFKELSDEFVRVFNEIVTYCPMKKKDPLPQIMVPDSLKNYDYTRLHMRLEELVSSSIKPLAEFEFKPYNFIKLKRRMEEGGRREEGGGGRREEEGGKRREEEELTTNKFLNESLKGGSRLEFKKEEGGGDRRKKEEDGEEREVKEGRREEGGTREEEGEVFHRKEDEERRRREEEEGMREFELRIEEVERRNETYKEEIEGLKEELKMKGRRDEEMEVERMVRYRGEVIGEMLDKVRVEGEKIDYLMKIRELDEENEELRKRVREGGGGRGGEWEEEEEGEEENIREMKRKLEQKEKEREQERKRINEEFYSLTQEIESKVFQEINEQNKEYEINILIKNSIW